MAYKGEHHQEHKSCKKYHKQGVTSYEMQDPELVFKSLAIKEGDVIIDLGCGAGDYSFRAAEITGEKGSVYPCDKWPELKDKLEKRAADSGFKNITPKQFDLTKGEYPFESNFADLCILVTVLHIPIIKKYSDVLFSEVKRILKPSGTLAILNCKKEERDFGPPIEMSLSPEETLNLVKGLDFYEESDYIDLGYNYLSLYRYRN